MRMLKKTTLTATLLMLTACAAAPTEPQAPPAAPPAAPAAEAGTASVPSTGAPPAASSAASLAEAPPSAAHDVWSEGMTKDQEIAFMKKNVVPEMGPIFKAYNPKRYAEFGCKTCHGPKFKEPKDYLPKLTLKDGQITAFAKEPEIAKFMAEQVVPHMAHAMGLAPYDPATHAGFGCNGCHTVIGK